MNEFGLAKNDRIYLRNDFKDIIKNGSRLRAGALVLWHRPNAAVVRARIGIIVSKKLGCAAQRVRRKRLLREVFRLNRHLIIDGVDCLIMPLQADVLKDYHTTLAAFLKLIKKAGIFKEGGGLKK